MQHILFGGREGMFQGEGGQNRADQAWERCEIGGAGPLCILTPFPGLSALHQATCICYLGHVGVLLEVRGKRSPYPKVISNLIISNVGNSRGHALCQHSLALGHQKYNKCNFFNIWGSTVIELLFCRTTECYAKRKYWTLFQCHLCLH